MPRTRASNLLALLPCIVLLVAGCDPEGPGASGTISLEATIDPKVFSTLAIRAFPNPAAASFDPGLPIPAGALPVDEDLARVSFPHHYQVGGGIGGTKIPDWRLVVWLSHRQAGAAERPETGDVYGSVAFKIDHCEGFYCGVTGGVDCTISDLVPAAQ